MEEISEILKNLQFENTNIDEPSYDNATVFTNPNKLPINQVFLTQIITELRNDINLDEFNDGSIDDVDKYFEQKRNVIPALDKLWLPKTCPIYPYEPYNVIDTKDDITANNELFLKTLNYLLSCNYHQFWCLIVFESKISLCLYSFLLNPILPHQLKHLNNEELIVFEKIIKQFLSVYRRLITFKESDEEYMSEDLGLKFLLERKLMNLPILITLILLYENIDIEFVNKLIKIYHKEESVVFNKEIEEILNQTLMTLEMIGGYVCGFEPDTVIIPIAIDEKPTVFSINWLYSICNYLLNTVITLNSLLKYYKITAYKLSLDKGIPYRLTYMYEKIFTNIYQYMNNRDELNDNDKRLSIIINEEIAFSRSIIIDIYNGFVSYCLDKALKLSGNPVAQQEIVEIYLKLMTTALEDEYFITDYNQKYDIGSQNEMFISCTDLDETRSDYILNCIQNYRRHGRICEALNHENLNQTLTKYKNNSSTQEDDKQKEIYENLPSTSKEITHNYNGIESKQLNNDEIEDLIRIVNDMFPHLGDGFILQCLEIYNYQPDQVITAILEENLPPHLSDIPFDTIRIPPEEDDHNKQEVLMQYRGKKPTYDDALKLLNDKKDMREIKTFILDGIEFTNEYDLYDDEYDDRLDEETVKVPDYGNEDLLKYNPNHDDNDAVSDTSYSENEYDEKGEIMIVEGNKMRDKSKDFCVDPAVIRERRDAKRQQQSHHRRQQPQQQQQQKPQPHNRDVVGKQKGQGQENNVLFNRHKKSVNKSSRANHNRKSGAQWKRNKGMLPS